MSRSQCLKVTLSSSWLRSQFPSIAFISFPCLVPFPCLFSVTLSPCYGFISFPRPRLLPSPSLLVLISFPCPPFLALISFPSARLLPWHLASFPHQCLEPWPYRLLPASLHAIGFCCPGSVSFPLASSPSLPLVSFPFSFVSYPGHRLSLWRCCLLPWFPSFCWLLSPW